MRTAAAALLVLATLVGAQTLRGGAQAGLPAKPFSVRPVNGPAVRLADLIKPRGAVLAFANPRDTEGAQVLVFFEQTQASLREQGVGFVAFALGYAQSGSVVQLVKDNGLTIPLVHDVGNRLARDYGVFASAAIVLVDPEGQVFRRYDATENTVSLGPQALAGLKEMREAFPDPVEEPAAPAAEPTTLVAEGPAPVGRPTDEQLRQRVAAGWQLIQLGHVAAALEDARKLLEQRGPTDLQATLWLAYCCEAARLYPEAAVIYRQVLQLQPGHAYALQAVARIDPQGRWRTPADLPRSQPAPPAPETAASSQGPATVGE